MALRIPFHKTVLLSFIAFLLLTGGAHAQAIVASPSAVTLTTQAGVSVTQDVFLSNYGNPVTILSISSDEPGWLSGAFFGGNSTIGPNKNGGLRIFANPSSLTAGAYTGRIALTTNDGPPTIIPVSFLIGANPGGSIPTTSPGSLYFTANPGQASVSQDLTITSSGTTVPVTLSSDVPWIHTTVVSANGSSVGSSPLILSVTAGPLSTPGIYTGTLRISPINSPVTIVPLTFTVGAGAAAPPTASPTQLTFSAPEASFTPAQNVNLNSSANGAVLGISSDTPWLTGSITSNLVFAPNAPATVAVVSGGGNLGRGIYTGHLSVTTTSGVATITAVLTVGSVPGGPSFSGSITVDRNSFAFQYPSDGLSTSVVIGPGNSALKTFNLATNCSGDWLRISSRDYSQAQLLGLPFGIYSLHVDIAATARLADGVYPCVLALTNPSVPDDVTNIKVILTVNVHGLTSAFAINPTALNFTASPGGAPQSQHLSLTAAPGTPVQLSITSFNGPFLSLASPSCIGLPNPTLSCNFTGSQDLVFTVNPANLTVLGKYSATLQFQSGSTISTLYLVLNLAPPVSTLTVDQPVLVFNAFSGGAPQTQTLAVSVPPGSTVQTILTTNSGDFFSLSSKDCDVDAVYNRICTLNGSQTLYVTVAPASWQFGLLSGNITLQSGNSTIVVPVKLVNQPEGTIGGTDTIAAPVSVSFAYQLGSGAIPPEQVILTAVPGAVALNLIQDGSILWLSANIDQGPLNSIRLGVNPAGLAAGTYYGIVFITSDAGVVSIPTKLLVTNAPVVQSTPGNLHFTYSGGSPLPQQTLSFAASDNSAKLISASSSANWVTLSSNSAGATPATLTVNVDASGLCNGLNSASILVTAAGAANSPFVVPVTVLVSGSNAVGCGNPTAPLTLSPASLTFGATAGASSPAPMTLSVTAPNATTAYSVSATVAGGTPAWLSVQPSGSLTGTKALTVIANPSGLSVGTYTGSITLVTNGVPQVVPVTFVVSATPPSLAATPNSLTFTEPAGQLLPAIDIQRVTISTTGASPISITGIQSDIYWLSANIDGSSILSSASPAILFVSPNPAAVPAGTYTGHLTVRTSNGLSAVITVTFNVSPPVLAISATPTSLTLSNAGTTSAPITVQSTNPSVTTFNLSVSSQGDWLRFGGRGTGYYQNLPVGTYAASVDPAVAAGLGAGTYFGNFLVSNPVNPDERTLISVTLLVSGPSNLAFGKQATQSSMLPGYLNDGPGAAVDAVTDGNFFDHSVTHTNADANAWWQVDLGASANITSVLVWNRTDCCSERLNDYWVFVSDTPFLPTDTPAILATRAGIFKSHQTSSPNPSAAIAVNGMGRYVRVQLSGTNNLSLAEVQVIGTAGTETNIARGKLASQSSTLAGYASAIAGAAVDGNTDGGFFNGSVTHTNADANAWWQVDLGASATVNSVVVWNRTDCCSSRLTDFWVFVSDTPFLATDTPATLQIRSGTFNRHVTSAPDPSFSIPFAAPGRYVRVQLTGTGNLSLAEVQVMGTGGTAAPANLAVNKPAAQSSTLAGYTTAGAGAAVDGNTDGGFFNGSVTHTNIDSSAWWQVDLGASASISSVVVWNRTDCCSERLNDYWVFVSDTPFLATDTPATLQGRAGTVGSHQITTPNPSSTISIPAQGRYVRVQLTGTNNLSLAEVQVFGQ